jgi:hypothetical protein
VLWAYPGERARATTLAPGQPSKEYDAQHCYGELRRVEIGEIKGKKIGE